MDILRRVCVFPQVLRFFLQYRSTFSEITGYIEHVKLVHNIGLWKYQKTDVFLQSNFSRINSSGFNMYLTTTILEEEMGRKDWRTHDYYTRR